MNRKKIGALLLFSICLPFYGGAFANSHHATPVVVGKAKQERLAPMQWVAGVVKERGRVTLSAEVDGRLIRLVDEGSRLKKGETIGRIDTLDLKLTLEAAKVEVAKINARLSLLEREIRRFEQLAKHNNAAQNQLDKAKTDRAVAESELNQARVRVQQARHNLEKSWIKAPFQGVVGRHHARVGEWLAKGSEVATFTNPSDKEIQGSVTLSGVQYLKVGAWLSVKSGERVKQARVRAIQPYAATGEHLSTLYLTFEASDWLIGETVKIQVPTEIPREVVTIPRDALVIRRGSTAVFRVKDDFTAERILVAPGAAKGDRIEIKEGISAGDQVITRGGERLRPGQQVKVLPPKPKWP